MHCVVSLVWGGVVRECLISFLVWYVVSLSSYWIEKTYYKVGDTLLYIPEKTVSAAYDISM